jgi:myo-inositol-1(or 4)-monophosphatase
MNRKIIDTIKELREPILQAFLKTKGIEKKKDGSFVTETDKMIENILTRVISEVEPDAAILGEETVSNESFVENFSKKKIYVIDPLDGTSNFVNDIPLFGISVGILEKDEKGHTPVDGVLYFPVTDELFRIDKGIVILEKSNQINEIHTGDMIFNRGIFMLNSSFEKRFYMKDHEKTVRLRKLGASIANLAYVITGSAIGTITKARIWDICAAVAIGKNLGIVMHEYSTGKEKLHFYPDDFIKEPKSWLCLKESYLFCRKKDYTLLKNTILEK